MPEVAFGTGAYRRSNGDLPEFRLVNMFAEAAPTSDGGVILLSRYGLLSSAARGAGPVRGVFSQQGTFDGDVFTVSGGSLYRAGTLLGAIDGTGPVSFAASATEVVVTAGGTAYSYNGTNLAAISFPDGANVTAVAFMAGLFVFLRAGTHRFYWSAVLDARTIDALDFASAENAPDELRDVKAIGDNLFLLGSETIEVWAITGALDLPFSRIQQRLYRKGVIYSGCAVELDNALHWVGNDGLVYRAADIPQRLSDHGIEERIGASATVSAFGFSFQGHKFFCIRLDAHTFAYDAATGQWCEFKTHGRDNWRACCAPHPDQPAIFGDDETGTLWELSGFEDGDDPMERLFTAGFAIKGGAQSIFRVNIENNPGRTELLAGQGSDPQIEMRFSTDQGATWGDWEADDLGAQGDYRQRPEWRALGMFDAPGGLMEFRVVDPVPLRISAVLVNEPGGGRSR